MVNNDLDRIWELMSRKLTNEIMFAELEELETLLKLQPLEAYSLEIMEDFWQSHPTENRQYSEYKYKQFFLRMQNEGLISKNTEDDHEQLISSVDNKKGFILRNIRKSIIAGSIAVLSIAAVFIFLLNTNSINTAEIAPNKASEITTKNGSKTYLVLADGTKVWLNAGSKLSYDADKYGDKFREVSLIGEAFFDVTKNPEKPFIIHTSNMDIKVLGTAFNVRCYPNEKKTETSLVRGRIEVTLKNRPSEKIYLKPNEKLTLINDNIVAPAIANNKKVKNLIEIPDALVTIGHLTHLNLDSTIVETSWVENKLEFRSEAFEDVASKMEKWYAVKIYIMDENLKKEHLTGSFETETVEQALSALQYTTKFKFTINKNAITITK